MFILEERKSTKLAQISSIYFKLKDYNKDLFDFFVQLQSSIYNKTNCEFELPLNKFYFIVDYLTKYDDVKFIPMHDDTKNLLKCDPTNFKVKPFDHQVQAINYGLNKEGWMLLDDCGLGKTLSMIYLAEELKRLNKIEHCLIICGVNSLKYNWAAEIEKFSKQSYKILGQKITKSGKKKVGSLKDRLADLKQPINEFFVILNVETIRDNDITNAIQKGKNKFDMIVLDEAHHCFVYDTEIDTDAGKLKIGDIVENKINCKVLSGKEKEYKEIEDYYKVDTDRLLKLTFIDNTGKEKELVCTPDHKIYTNNRGYIKAEDLKESDEFEFI